MVDPAMTPSFFLFESSFLLYFSYEARSNFISSSPAGNSSNLFTSFLDSSLLLRADVPLSLSSSFNLTSTSSLVIPCCRDNVTFLLSFTSFKLTDVLVCEDPADFSKRLISSISQVSISSASFLSIFALILNTLNSSCSKLYRPLRALFLEIKSNSSCFVWLVSSFVTPWHLCSSSFTALIFSSNWSFLAW